MAIRINQIFTTSKDSRCDGRAHATLKWFSSHLLRVS